MTRNDTITTPWDGDTTSTTACGDSSIVESVVTIQNEAIAFWKWRCSLLRDLLSKKEDALHLRSLEVVDDGQVLFQQLLEDRSQLQIDLNKSKADCETLRKDLNKYKSVGFAYISNFTETEFETMKEELNQSKDVCEAIKTELDNYKSKYEDLIKRVVVLIGAFSLLVLLAIIVVVVFMLVSATMAKNSSMNGNCNSTTQPPEQQSEVFGGTGGNDASRSSFR